MAGIRLTALPVLAFIAACLLAASPAGATGHKPDEHLREARFHNVAWRLAKGNAPFCASSWASIGLTLGATETQHDKFFVLAVAPDSPAERAGLVAGNEIISLEGMDYDFRAKSSEETGDRLYRIHRAIETLLDEAGSLSLTWQDAHRGRQEAVVEAQGVCPSRFLTREGKRIGADGVNVRFGKGFAGFEYPEDEFAAAIAHELAHNLMGHPYWLDREGRKRSNIRMTEREADRLMPWLLANAGYDPHAARRFMERWGPRHGGGLLRKRTHDGWDERADSIDSEVALVEQLWESEGAADWRARFEREEGLAEASP
ncbi:hypothetical protein [Altererythrobacter sp. MF3-039]|uniref:hypothetical protein n=1 Tax=Altererythrobacter sp. MF3-039 TaxID=3252901 RepID=UPI00390CD021